MCVANAKLDNRKNKTLCDESRAQCDKLYSLLSTVEEDCKTYRIYLGCLSILKDTQTLCHADFHYWMILSTTEKLILEKCSPGDTGPIEPPREVFNNPVVPPRSSKNLKISSLSPCLDSLRSSTQIKSEYRTCALFGHPNLVTYSGERQTCRLQGAWPLVNNRYISVQVSGKPYHRSHFRDISASKITQISVILKPDGKCLGDLAVPTLIYVATARSRLAPLFLNNRREMHQSMISIKVVEVTDTHEKVDLWFGYINTRVVITRAHVADDEYSLSVSVLLPTIVAMAKPRSKQHSLVHELCSLGCSAPESVDDLTILSQIYIRPAPTTQVRPCDHSGLNGVFFDVCFLMSQLISDESQSSVTKKCLQNYVITSVKQVKNDIFEFSKVISENLSIDLNPRKDFQPFRPVWKIIQLNLKSRRSKRSSSIRPDVQLSIRIFMLVTTLISAL